MNYFYIGGVETRKRAGARKDFPGVEFGARVIDHFHLHINNFFIECEN